MMKITAMGIAEYNLILNREIKNFEVLYLFSFKLNFSFQIFSFNAFNLCS